MQEDIAKLKAHALPAVSEFDLVTALAAYPWALPVLGLLIAVTWVGLGRLWRHGRKSR